MKTVVTSNISQVSERFKRMSHNLPGVIDRAVYDLVDKEALPLFGNTVQTWQTQPRFSTRKTARGYGVEVQPLYPFEWVNRGTRIRYATMSKDWRSKTRPNVIGSTAGAGRMLFVSRKHPRPGIVARNFTDIILKRVQSRAANRIRRALSDASYGAGVGL